MFYTLLKPFIASNPKLSVKRGQFVYHEGDIPENLYLVESGLVGLFHISESGKETFLRVFGQGNIFGHRSYFAETPYHATSIALEDSNLVILPKNQCQELCIHNPEFLKKMTSMLAKNLGEAELRMAGLQDKSAPNRIAQALVYLKLKYPDHAWTRKDIAEYSGSTPESVTRVLTKLADLGLITKEGRDLTIKDSQKVLKYDSHQG